MSRYRGPRLRLVRRLGKLPALTKKISKKKTLPGEHGEISFKKASKFKIRLKEKQKLRFHYGMSERQLLNYVKKSRKKKGSSGKLLLTLLEMRLDNLVYRSGFAPTIIAAKQLITHGHVLLNGKRVNIPSYGCKPNDVLTPRNSLSSTNLIKRNLRSNEALLIPQHLLLNKEKLEARILRLVNRKSLSLIVNELLVIEYYSRKL